MRSVSISVGLLLLATFGFAAEPPDTKASRVNAARSYAEAAELSQKLDDAFMKEMKDLGPAEREEALSLKKKLVNVDAFREIMIQSLASTFTTRELQALSAFVKTVDGRTIMKKYDAYRAVAKPAVDAEEARQIARIEAYVAEKEKTARPSPDSSPVSTLATDEAASKERVQYDKLLHLIEEFLADEEALQTRLTHLVDNFPGVDTTPLYEGSDLTSDEGIQKTRRHIEAFNAANDGHAAAQEQFWADMEDQVRTNDLPEPLASGLRASLSVDQNNRMANFRAMISASRAQAFAAGHLADIAERHLGQVKWQNNTLEASDKAIGAEIHEAMTAVAEFLRQADKAGTALRSDSRETQNFVRTNLRRLNQDIWRRYERSVAPQVER